MKRWTALVTVLLAAQAAAQESLPPALLPPPPPAPPARPFLTTLAGCDAPVKDASNDTSIGAGLLPSFYEDNDKNEPKVKGVSYPAGAADYLNGIGSAGKCWELSWDTGFGNRRILTQHFEIARAFKFYRRSLAVVLRVGLGAADDTTSGVYSIQGVAPSLGLRHFPLGGFAVEWGFRLVPGWSGPHDREAETQTLALDATLTSGIGDDTAWLPFSNTGLQFYVDFETRSGLGPSPSWAFLVGARYGGAVSLGSMQLHTWLGPQSAFVGNAYVEAFLGIAVLSDVRTALQLGGHVDVSLSSIWPGAQAFPLAGNGYIGWAPVSWLSFRAFVGVGGTLGGIGKDPFVMNYGLSLKFWVP